MSYELRVARQAEAYFRRLDRRTRDRILRRLEQIAANPYGSYTKPLTNAEGRRAARVGSWRIVFAVDEETATIDVSAIGPRGGVYRDL